MPRMHSNRFNTYEQLLVKFTRDVHTLSGIRSSERRQTLVLQIISSVRRIEYVKSLDARHISPERANPRSDIFCPLRAAIIWRNRGNIDEAIWLVFLATHFGKHADDKWQLMKDIYGAFGERSPWTWTEVTAHRRDFVKWAKTRLPELLNDGQSRRFSNHRKYESKKSEAIITTLLAYVDLIESYGTHRDWIVAAHKEKGQNPAEAFQFLYDSLDAAKRFGRLGRFDFLTMLGKLDLMPIEPGIAYLKGATGPLSGAKLLVDNDTESHRKIEELEEILQKIGSTLQVGMQVLEDSLCNWQKSPEAYEYFSG
ncbi:MAG: hypothetical protein KBA75_00870 [Alphaproteobacteria bacterium]|nr:hypothetical protein [Alphaproteobacteria bacterium]